MIDFLSSWAKNLGLAIVIVSILEMLLPNNKTKKYIRMVMGIFVIFNIVSPLIENKSVFNVDVETFSSQIGEVNQTSMEDRIQELYIQEIEKDITEKLEEKGFEINKCKVSAVISDNEEETKINKIELNIEKGKEQEKENMEDKVVDEIQKIKKVTTKLDTDNKEEDKKLSKAEIQNVKQFLIEEYEVSEQCLKIN